MSLRKNCVGVVLVGAAFAALSGSAKAAVVMDQIGSNPGFFTGQGASVSQDFETAFSGFSTSVVDDFSVTGATTLTNVSAAVLGFNGLTSYSGVTGWDVAIYSSSAAAASSLTGDVYNGVFAPAAVTLTTPFSGDALSALVSIPTSISLSGAGTYYVSVSAFNAFSTNGEVGVYTTSGPVGAAPGGLNDFQANPGGGFGFTGNISQLGTNAAYAITSGSTVPEPASAALLGIVGGCMALKRGRRSMQAIV